jgi:hypothetical protein
VLNWGGLMRRKISCITIKSALLNDDIVSENSVSLFKIPQHSIILNNYNDFIPGSTIYTRKLNITTIQTNDYLTEESLDFYA